MKDTSDPNLTNQSPRSTNVNHELPVTTYANAGGLINQTKLNLVLSHSLIACITEPGTVTLNKILPRFSNFISNKRTAILYNDAINEAKSIDLGGFDIEISALQFKLTSNATVIYILAYRSPSLSIEEQATWIQSLDAAISHVKPMCDFYFFFGDTNYKSPAISPSVHDNYTDQLANDAAEMLFLHGLTSIIDFPTMKYDRGCGVKNSAIDWILVPEILLDSLTAEALAPIEKRGEHIAIELFSEPISKEIKFNYDYSDQNAYLKAKNDFERLSLKHYDSRLEPNESNIEFLADILTTVCSKANSRYPLTQSKHLGAPWMNKRIVGLIAKRNAKGTSKVTKKKLTKLISDRVSESKSSWIEREIDDKLHNGRNFFQLSRSILKPDVNLVVNNASDDDIAEHFASISSNKWKLSEPIDFGRLENTMWQFPNYNSSQIREIVRSLKKSKGAGPDKITNLFISQHIDIPEFLAFLTQLINMVLACGVIPSMWKRARIKVIKKKQNMGSTLNNARPLFISNAFIGILEACIYPFISQAFNNANQFGYTPGMSVEHPISILDKLIRSYRVNGYKYIAIVLCDVQKAFQTCPRYTIVKAAEKKFSGNALKLIYNFLSKWFLCFNDSNFYELFSGVPTGLRNSCHLYKSVANEILANKYNIQNWMPGIYKQSAISQFILWADDTLKLIGCTSLNALKEAVQAAFRIFSNFESESGIQFHFDKFDIVSKHDLQITFRNNTIDSKREGLYLGYVIEQSKNSNFLVSSKHWDRQYSRTVRALPAFWTLNKLLTIPQMLKVYRLYIIPRLFGVTPVQHLSKKILKKIDTLLRKFIATIWKCHPSMTTPVFISFRKILKFRFSNFSKISSRQKLVSIYYHDRNSKVFKNHPLRKWSGMNRYSTEMSWLDQSLSLDKYQYLIFPESLESVQTLAQKIENRKLHIQSIILKNNRKLHINQA